MEPSVHKRKPGTHEAICGAGYPWPSSVLFADAGREVTCASCKRHLARCPRCGQEVEVWRAWFVDHEVGVAWDKRTCLGSGENVPTSALPEGGV